MPELSVDLSQAATFLRKGYPGRWPGCIHLEVFEITKGGDGRTRKKRIWHKELYDATELEGIYQRALDTYQEQGYHIFFSVGLVKPGSPTVKKDTVSHVKLLWADVDHKTEEQGREIFQSCPVAPTGIVRSGSGFHFYWDLGEYVAVDESVAQASKKVHAWVGGDATWQVNRLLRLPGSWNCKGEPVKCEVIHWREAFTTIADILSCGLTYKEIRLAAEVKDKYIKRGEIIDTEVGRKEGRSGRDFAIIKDLLRNGHTHADIISIFTNPDYGCSAKALEKADPQAYLNLTISKATEEIKTGEDGGVFDDGQYVYRRKELSNGMVETERIANFCIVPMRFVELTTADIELVEVEIRAKRKIVLRTLTPTALLDFRSFQREVAMPGLSWIGSTSGSSLWQNYMNYLFEREITVEVATDVVGWEGTGFVLKDQVLFNDHVVYIETGKVAPEVIITQEGFDLDTFMKEVPQKLGDVHLPHVSFPLFGWTLAALFAPRIREAYRSQFPLMCLQGLQGTGKTTLIQTFRQYLLGCSTETSFRSSPPLIRRSLAGSNSIPVWIDEYEAEKGPRGNQLDSFFRLSYNAGCAPVMERDPASLKKIDDAKLGAPVLLSTMTGIEDDALLDRTYLIRMGRFVPEVGGQALEWFEDLPCGAFLWYWLQVDPTEWISKIKEIGRVIGTEVTERQRMGFAVTGAVLEWCAKKWDWGLDRYDCKKWWAKNQDKKSCNTAYSAFDACLAHALRHRLLVNGQDYRFDEAANELIFWTVPTWTALIEAMPKVGLNYPCSQSWFYSVVQDGLEDGFTAQAGQCKRSIGGKLRHCFVLTANRFTMTMEALPEFM